VRTSNVLVILYVHDMDRAIAFYRDTLSLDLVERSPGWSMLSCGDALIGLHIIEPGVEEGIVSHAGLNLQVDELEPAVAEIQKAGGRLRAIREADPPHVPVRLAEVNDSEGNGFELRQYV
jgi:predicted enzyme related to lactoylglutathione lyase